MRVLGLIFNTSKQRAATIGYGTNAEALKIKHGNHRGDRSPIRSLASLVLLTSNIHVATILLMNG